MPSYNPKHAPRRSSTPYSDIHQGVTLGDFLFTILILPLALIVGIILLLFCQFRSLISLIGIIFPFNTKKSNTLTLQLTTQQQADHIKSKVQNEQNETGIDQIDIKANSDNKKFTDKARIQALLFKNNILFDPAQIRGSFWKARSNLNFIQKHNQVNLEDITYFVPYLGELRSNLQSAIDKYKK